MKIRNTLKHAVAIPRGGSEQTIEPGEVVNLPAALAKPLLGGGDFEKVKAPRNRSKKPAPPPDEGTNAATSGEED